MATRPGRIGLAQRALLNFHEQTYEDKELIIVSSHRFSMSDETAQLAVTPNVRWVDMPEGAALHEALTKGFKAADGKWITFWDDDNLWHPRRLERQILEVEDTPRRPCFIRDNLIAFMDTREIFVCLRRKNDETYDLRVNAYSLVSHRDYFAGFPQDAGCHPIIKSIKPYPIKGRGDPQVIPFEWKLGVIGVRGDNVRSYDAHRNLVTRPRVVMKVDWLLSMREELERTIDQLTWWEPGLWHICGLDGVAFSYEIKNAHGGGLNPVGDPDDDTVREEQEV
jgi:glycosyltransferase involved in cell wall biosynthesis